MAIIKSYTEARRSLASLWDRLEESGEVAILRRRGHKDLALLDAEELAALRETARLLRAPNTALRLLVALNRAFRATSKPMSVDQLLSEMNLGDGSGDDI
ncbi:MAG: type II toxin-antitoxin system Phd/YefM family antitoxin [Gammaproteobacteria bacterium]|nr:type II toxin-antitoxin system Phd/YefM family antitoxin [Gammaproteobacteria bacterium]